MAGQRNRTGGGAANVVLENGLYARRGLVPGTDASLVDVTAGKVVETVKADASGKAAFTTVPVVGTSYVVDAITRTAKVTAASNVPLPPPDNSGLPVSNWRVPLKSAVVVTGTTADAANSAALSLGPVDKALVNLTILPNTTATIVYDAEAIAEPGGVLYIGTSSGATANRVLTWEYSSDNGGTWGALPITLVSTVIGVTNGDQILDIPAGGARKLRLTYQNTHAATTHVLRTETPKQLQVDPFRNPLAIVSGMSITNQSHAGTALADDIRRALPGSDPIVMSIARSGAKPADMLNEQLRNIVGKRDYLRRVLLDMGPNPFLGGGVNYATVPAGARDVYRADAAALTDWATTQNRRMTYIYPTFINPLNFDAGGATNIKQEDVVDGPNVSIANQANGMRPFIQGIYLDTIKAMAGSWNPKYDVGMFDGWMPSILSWDFWKQLRSGMTPQDGTHPQGPAAIMYRFAFLDAFLKIMGRPDPVNYLERKLAAAEVGNVNLAQKNRFYLGLATWPDTTDATALSNRALLKARIDALTTVYPEPAGATPPTNLPGIFVSFDDDDMATMFSDDAATISAKDHELVRVVNSKVGGRKSFCAASAASAPFRQPQFMIGQAPGEKGLSFDGASYLDMDAETYGALNAAALPFIIGLALHPTQPSTGTLRGLFNLLGTGVLQMRFASNSSQAQILAATVAGGNAAVLATEAAGKAAVLGAPAVYLLSYDGVNSLKLRHNGEETASAVWTKPAWTATGGRRVSQGFAGRTRGFHLITGAWTAATLTALENRLRAQVGA